MTRTLLTLALLLSIVGAKAQSDTIYPFDISGLFLLDPAHDQGCEYYFLSPHDGYNVVDPEFRSVLMIADKHGELMFYKGLPGTSNMFFNFVFDFKLQPNGQITYHSIDSLSPHYVMDSTLTIVDTIKCKNGLGSDAHELLLTADGYTYNLCYDTRVMNLDTLYNINNEQMSSQAIVEGNAIQIVDPNDQLVYQWSGFDYLDFSDMDYTNLDDTAYVDWMHANSISLDDNGDMIISIRNFNEVIKISRQDSSVMWRLGGKHSDFAFPNDSIQFKLQHHATYQPNGNITILDNGTYHNPPVARAIEYSLNATNDTADLVWEYRKQIESIALGSHQILPNGNHLINWGTDINDFYTPIVEVDQNYNEVLNIEFPAGFFSYRAFCFDLPWQVKRPEIECGYDSNTGDITLDVINSSFSDHYWLNSGETVTSLAVADTGKYQVFGYNGFGWVGSETFYIADLSNPCDTVDTTIGLADAEILASLVKLYPNPATDAVHLKLPETLASNSSTIQVYNALGQLVSSMQLQSDQEVIINTAAFSRGTYVVTLSNPLANWRGRFVLTE